MTQGNDPFVLYLPHALYMPEYEKNLFISVSSDSVAGKLPE